LPPTDTCAASRSFPRTTGDGACTKPSKRSSKRRVSR
jgi:hypothetical protein